MQVFINMRSLVRHKVLADTCTNVASALTNVAGITASICEFINEMRTDPVPHGIFHAEHVSNLKCREN